MPDIRILAYTSIPSMLLGLSLFSTPLYSSEEELSDILQHRLAQPIQPQFGACNGDLLDYPLPPKGELVLQNIHGNTVDIQKDYAGHNRVLIHINPSITRYQQRFVNWQEIDDQPAPAVAFLKQLMKDCPSATYLAIWAKTDKKKPADAQAAQEYMQRYGLEIPVLLDQKDPTSRRHTSFVRFVNAKTPGHDNGGTIVCVLNTDGKVVYRSHEKRGVHYHATRNILERLTNPTYDDAVRKEFIPHKQRLLPIITEAADGLRYSDNFEGYTDNHSFLLEPRWGFRYASQAYLDIRPDMLPHVGRNNSQAIYIHDDKPDPGLTRYGLFHDFPAPLLDGHITFHIRRHNVDLPERPSRPYLDVRRAFCIAFGTTNSYELAGHIMATGDWMKETFTCSFRTDLPGSVALSPDAWHTITVHCTPTQMATVSVDGVEIGQLQSESIDWVGFRTDELKKNFYLDDVEIFYKGHAKTLRTQHRALQPTQTTAVEPFTPTETALLQQQFTTTNRGSEKVSLPANAVPRTDLGADKLPLVTFDAPLTPTTLLMENIRQPGKIEDVLKKHAGKIIWITKAHKGDHNTERNMRKRTFKKSLTVFNRINRLAKEYGPKGVVIIGVAAHDGGHRDTVTTYDDRIRTAMECIHTSQAIAEEGGLNMDQIIYGFEPHIYTDLYAERHSNQIRLWNKTILRRSLEDGSFAGFGADTILDQTGKIVFRGSGPDGSGYWQMRYCFDRLLDPEFDAACRQEFRNPDLSFYQSPLLPIQKKNTDGLSYSDDFESYTDIYDLALQPRWGFTYKRIPNADTPALIKQMGRAQSQGLLLNLYYWGDVLCGNKAGALGIRHKFPTPLTDGHIRFYIKRGPKVGILGQSPIFRFALSCFNEKGEPLETLTTEGPVLEESFVTLPTTEFLKNWNCYKYKGRDKSVINNTGIALPKEGWHEIRIVCKTGSQATVLLDGIQITQLSSAQLSAIELRGETSTGTYVDDFELFYQGNPETLATTHQQALQDNFIQRTKIWTNEK